MAEGSQSVSSFPLPPMQYVMFYTDENVRKGRTPKPPAPVKDGYTMFGVPYRADDHIIRPLEAQGLLRLYPHQFDHKKELKKLNYSILVNFLDLLDILIKAPDSPKRCEKIDDLTLLFIHMHHLINEFRPHQARETLRVMMDVQKRNRIETFDRFQHHLGHVQEMIQASLSALPDDATLDSKMAITLLDPPASASPAPPTLSFSAWSTHSERNGDDEVEEGEMGNIEMFKTEVEDEEDEEEEEEKDCGTLDEMMCDIVDAMN